MKKEMIVILALLIVIPPIISANTCSVVQRTSCNGTVVMGLSSETNAHVELASQENYDYSLCCDFGTGDTNCSGTNKILGLSSETNAHAEAPSSSNYNYSVCYEDVLCEAKTSCEANETEIISLSNETNAHVGGIGDYDVKICCEGFEEPVQPESEVAFWADINQKPITSYNIVYDTTELNLILKASGLEPGTLVTFTIKESDLGLDDTIRTFTAYIDENGSAETTWLVTDEDLEKGASDVLMDEQDIYEIGEFYFEVGGEPSGILQVSIIDELNFCSPIGFCRDYETQSECEVDVCSVSSRSVEDNYGGNVCGEIVTDEDCEIWSSCSCEWKEGACGPAKEDHINCSDSENPSIIGQCFYNENSSDDCEDGFLEYSWEGTYEWDTNNIFGSEKEGEEGYIEDSVGVWHYDPQRKSDTCLDGSNIVQCPVNALLPFFNVCNIIASIILIIIVYYLLSKKRCGKKSSKKKSVRKKKKKR